jgi:hypothetical protein
MNISRVSARMIFKIVCPNCEGETELPLHDVPHLTTQWVYLMDCPYCFKPIHVRLEVRNPIPTERVIFSEEQMEKLRHIKMKGE